MLSIPLKPRPLGFSLIELMIAVAITTILVAIAVPSFRAMIRNSQIRNAAESVVNGLQRARAEAVARNTNVAFTFGTDSGWTISVVNPASTIDSRLSTEGSTNVTITALAADLTTAANSITFNTLGGVVTNPVSISRVNFAAVGGDKNLRVTVGVGGNAKMCDPSLATGSSPRAC